MSEGKHANENKNENIIKSKHMSENRHISKNENIIKSEHMSENGHISKNENIIKSKHVSENRHMSENGHISKNENIIKSKHMSENRHTSENRHISKNKHTKKKQKVIEVNVGFTVLKIIAIILIISLITAQTVRTIIQARTSTSEAETTEEEATYYMVDSTEIDEETGEYIQVPVPVGYTASEIEGETGVSTGFVIYEGEVDWEEIGIETTTASVTSIQAQKTVAASETGIVNASYEYSDDYTSCAVTLTSDYEITLIEILEDETEEYTEDTSFEISEDGLVATGEFTENSTNVYKITYDLDETEEETKITIEITEISETETEEDSDTRIRIRCNRYRWKRW